MKKAKMIALAILIGVGMFLFKLLQRDTVDITEIVLYALGFGVGSFLGLLWIANFVFNKRAFLFMGQGAFMIFLQVLFLFLFFYASFGRVYESALFFVVIAVFVFANYVLFSMVNIFVVSTEKPLPLVNVAKSTAYIFSLATIYFGSFALLNMDLHVGLIILLEWALLFVVLTMYFTDLEVGGTRIKSVSLMISYAVLSVFVSGMMLSERLELLAFLPVVSSFILCNVFNESLEKKFSWINLLQGVVFFLILLAFLA